MTTLAARLRTKQQTKVEKPIYEKVLIYGENPVYAWAPVELLEKVLDPKTCRLVYPATGAMIGASLIGVLIGGLFGFGIGVMFSLLHAAIFFPVGAILGLGAGYWLHPLMIPSPEWWCWREEVDGKRRLTPMSHDRLLLFDWLENGAAEGAMMPMVNVYRASFMYEVERMDDERLDFEAGMNMWQKIQITALAAIALGFPFIIGFWYLATESSG